MEPVNDRDHEVRSLQILLGRDLRHEAVIKAFRGQRLKFCRYL